MLKMGQVIAPITVSSLRIRKRWFYLIKIIDLFRVIITGRKRGSVNDHDLIHKVHERMVTIDAYTNHVTFKVHS